MKYVPCLPAILLPLVLSACSTSAPIVEVTRPSGQLMATNIAYGPGEDTMLLVSLEDGSVIKQTISIDADICFKQNSHSSTTCFTQGSPIVDPVTDAVIGYEMIEDHIDLVARPD